MNLEQFAYETMRTTRNEPITRAICEAQVRTLQAELEPAIQRADRGIDEDQARGRGLFTQTYGEHVGIDDTEMLAKRQRVRVLKVAAAVLAVSSAWVHATTLTAVLASGLLSLGLAILWTGVAAWAGHLVFDAVIARSSTARASAGLLCFALALWAIVSLARARTVISELESTAVQQTEGAVIDPQDAPDAGVDSALQIAETNLRRLLTWINISMLLAADLSLMLVVGSWMEVSGNPKFVAWMTMGQLKKSIEHHRRQRDQLVAELASATASYEKGIARGRQFTNDTKLPFFQLLVTLASLTATATVAHAQTATHHEVLLIDASSSIGANGSLFNEYLAGVRQLLGTEPPNSNVWVETISRNSFSGGSTVLRGRTPPVQAPFIGNLNRARAQLVTAFDRAASDLRPTSPGSDVLGGLLRAVILIESTTASPASGQAREIIVFSDAVHQADPLSLAGHFNPAELIAQLRRTGLLVRLAGYRVSFLGVTTAGQSPSQYQRVREFWRQLVTAAGGTLAAYSAETRLAGR